jgi:hypothetical protein
MQVDNGEVYGTVLTVLYALRIYSSFGVTLEGIKLFLEREGGKMSIPTLL